MSENLSPTQLDVVARLMCDAGVRPAGAITAILIAGGRSNRTFRLDDGTSRWILRTPPIRGRTPSAHDVAREYRVTSALAGTDVPVARPLLLCEDEATLGGPFTVAEYIDGAVVQSASDLSAVPEEVLGGLMVRLVGARGAPPRGPHRGRA